MRREELLVYPTAEQRDNSDIKLFAIHMVDQTDEDFFRPACAQVMNQKKNFDHVLIDMIVI